ncbi:MAG: FAD-dependent oxidoreductase [Marmoricola sp.]
MRRVAVVGSGVSGLVAAHLLGKHAHVTLYEADARLGGHADTHRVDTAAGPVSIDTGFIVHNERTYPTLLRLFAELGVPTQESDMSMSVRDERTGLEYAGALGARGLFPTWRNVVNPRFWVMLLEILRFHRAARAVLADDGADTTLAAFLEHGRYSRYFRTHFMTPLVACVWSCDPLVALEYPARYLFAFLEHHGMLTVFGSPTWRTVTGGSHEYVRRVAAALPDVRLGTKVTDVLETPDGVRVTDGSGAEATYDAVVIATHPDQALSMLGEPTPLQREVLGAITYSDNVAQLHTDTSLLPRARGAWGSWNYQRRRADDGRVLVTYDLSRLMRLPGWQDAPVAGAADGSPRYLVTLNGTDIVDPASVVATREYAHPIYTPASVAAQSRLPEINSDRIAFAGAYHGWGFHEDGALSGLKAAEHLLGAPAAWDTTPTTPTPPTRRAVRYRTTIRHTRTAPLRSAFTYRSTSWLVDLDDLPGRGFQARDHVGDPDRSLRENVEAVLAEHGVDLDGGRIRMLTQPRSLGYVFNPITVFWCDHRDGSRAAVVIEVHNTYGGRHAYVVHPDEHGRARIDKQLYVSPFNDTSGEYAVLVPEPGERVQVSVTLRREGHPPYVATLTGHAEPGDRPRPTLSSHLVMARIRRQGIALWLRRLPVQLRPAGHDKEI